MSYYEITGADLKEAAKAAYELSDAQGLGFLHHRDGGLSDEEVQHLVDRERPNGYCALGMDYVNGRSCKFYVSRVSGRLFIKSNWYDHSDSDLIDLLRRINKTDATMFDDLPVEES